MGDAGSNRGTVMRRLWRAIPIALVAGQVSGFAAAQTAVGTAVSVVPAASNVRNGTPRTLAIADAIEQDDRIRTGPSGATRIRFRDDTVLTISANADLAVDRSVFDGSEARNLTIDLARGALRFVSGLSPQRSYEIRTHTATIGVRGTVVQLLATNHRVVAHSLESQVVVCQIGIPLPLPGVSSVGCRELRAGKPALAVTPRGFSQATAQEVARLTRLLDGAHLAL